MFHDKSPCWQLHGAVAVRILIFSVCVCNSVPAGATLIYVFSLRKKLTSANSAWSMNLKKCGSASSARPAPPIPEGGKAYRPQSGLTKTRRLITVFRGTNATFGSVNELDGLKIS